MIKSKMNFRTQGYEIAFYSIAIIVCSANFYFIVTEKPTKSSIVNSGDIFWKWLIFIGIVLFLLNLLRRSCPAVTIDLNKVTIKNLLTRSVSEYLFSDIDDYVQYVDPNDKITQNDIYFLRERIIFGRIRSEYYTNLDELIAALEEGIKRDRASRTSA